jgi:hypothetical protein
VDFAQLSSELARRTEDRPDASDYGTTLMWPPAIRQRPLSEIQTLV